MKNFRKKADQADKKKARQKNLPVFSGSPVSLHSSERSVERHNAVLLFPRRKIKKMLKTGEAVIIKQDKNATTVLIKGTNKTIVLNKNLANPITTY